MYTHVTVCCVCVDIPSGLLAAHCMLSRLIATGAVLLLLATWCCAEHHTQAAARDNEHMHAARRALSQFEEALDAGPEVQQFADRYAMEEQEEWGPAEPSEAENMLQEGQPADGEPVERSVTQPPQNINHADEMDDPAEEAARAEEAAARAEEAAVAAATQHAARIEEQGNVPTQHADEPVASSSIVQDHQASGAESNAEAGSASASAAGEAANKDPNANLDEPAFLSAPQPADSDEDGPPALQDVHTAAVAEVQQLPQQQEHQQQGLAPGQHQQEQQVARLPDLPSTQVPEAQVAAGQPADINPSGVQAWGP